MITIAVADAEKEYRRLAREIAEDEGFDFFPCSGESDCVHWFEKTSRRRKWNAVFWDISFSRSCEIIARFQAQGVKVIAMEPEGRALRTFERNASLAADFRLKKPFFKEEAACALREVLSGSPQIPVKRKVRADFPLFPLPLEKKRSFLDELSEAADVRSDRAYFVCEWDSEQRSASDLEAALILMNAKGYDFAFMDRAPEANSAKLAFKKR